MKHKLIDLKSQHQYPSSWDEEDYKEDGKEDIAFFEDIGGTSLIKRAEVPVEITYNPKTKKISATGYWDDVHVRLSATRTKWIKLERVLEKNLGANIPFAWRPIKPLIHGTGETRKRQAVKRLHHLYKEDPLRFCWDLYHFSRRVNATNPDHPFVGKRRLPFEEWEERQELITSARHLWAWLKANNGRWPSYMTEAYEKDFGLKDGEKTIFEDEGIWPSGPRTESHELSSDEIIHLASVLMYAFWDVPFGEIYPDVDEKGPDENAVYRKFVLGHPICKRGPIEDLFISYACGFRVWPKVQEILKQLEALS